MKWTTALAISLGLLLSQCGGNVGAQDAAVVPCHDCYVATAYVQLSDGLATFVAWDADDNRAIDKSVALAFRNPYACDAQVEVVYHP